MKYIKYILLFFFSVAFLFQTKAQKNYDHAIGLRFGYPLSLSYKKFVSNPNALEGNLSFSSNRRRDNNWMALSGAYLHHKTLKIEGVNNLNWYLGGGGSILFWNFASRSRFNSNRGETSFSIDGYLGLEYTFDDIPLNVTVDWTPSLFINGYISGFGGAYGAVAVRYILD